MQLHNILVTSLTPKTGEAVGNSIGTIVQVAEPKDDGVGGDVLRIRVAMDITKALPRCCKLRAKGKHIGWALLKYECLPNFCYWCGRVDHVEKDCKVWLKGKGSLKKENQQYDEWLCAESLRQNRKSVVVVSEANGVYLLGKKDQQNQKKKRASTCTGVSTCN